MEYMRTLYLDLDGVLADFDRSACKMLGTTNSYKFEFVYGQDMFWERLNRDPHFFRNLELMPDAMILWDAVKHMNLAILTALPSSRAAQVDEQCHFAEVANAAKLKFVPLQTTPK
jgi:5'(3')-deoxyribonucleotidase